MKDYAFYSGLGMQLLITILVFAGVGVYLDKKYNNNQPLFSIILSLLGIGLGLFSVIRQISNKTNKKK